MKLSLKRLFFGLFAAAGVLLSACTPGTLAFTPQQAAVQAATRMRGSTVTIQQDTIQIRQSVESGKSTFVLLSYTQMAEGHPEQCLSMFATRRNPLNSWTSAGGGGGCTWQIGGGSPEPPQPVDVSSGNTSSSGPNDPGFSDVNGLVYQKDIVKVRVTWNDNAAQEADVINESYLIVRIGNYRMAKLEGLDAKGKAVYQYAPPQPAQGKE